MAARKRCGMDLEAEVTSEGALARDSLLITLLQLYYKFFLKGRSQQHAQWSPALRQSVHPPPPLQSLHPHLSCFPSHLGCDSHTVGYVFLL